MAHTQERKNKNGEIISYSIRVHKGNDPITGKQLKPYSMTWYPPADKSEKWIKKELKRQEIMFEDACKNGTVANTTIKLADFCPQYLDIMESSLSPLTLQEYSRMIKKSIIPFLGHLKLKDIKTMHIQDYIQHMLKQPKIKRNGKTDEGKTLTPATVQRYLVCINWQEGDWLFTTWDGSIMHPDTPSKQWTAFLKRHGLPHIKFHSIRHTSATLLLYGGVNLKQVQNRLGHGKIETTNKYLHAIEEADVKAVNILDLMLNENR